MRQPSLFIPHGAGPCFFMENPPGPPGTWDGMAAFLRGLRHHFPEPPRAIVVVSAHWETEVPSVSTHPAPPLLHDYGGDRSLPPELTSLEWPAPGAPDVAAEVIDALRGAGIEARPDAERGYDHGVFVPMKVAFPEAEIPVAAMSIRADLDAEAHLQIGEALAPLRDRGVAIIGSGFSFHNIALAGTDEGAEAASRFADWLDETVALEAPARHARLASWAEAPAARQSHVREEHLIPLMVVAGAAPQDRGRTIYDEESRCDSGSPLTPSADHEETSGELRHSVEAQARAGTFSAKLARSGP